MTTDLVPQIPPARSAVIERGDDRTARFTRPWYRYLSLLQQQTAADITSMATDSITPPGSYVDPVLSDAVEDMQAMQTELRELREHVFELQKDINGLRQGLLQ